MKKNLFPPLLFLLLLQAPFAHGWGVSGHRIVGAIAATYLTDEARAAVRDLLGDKTLYGVATWADGIKYEEEFKWTAPLHYINLPRGAARIDLGRDCPKGVCVVAAIRRYGKTLANRSAPREERIAALKFLVHFVGDVHQPMHASFGDDHGGNLVEVTFFGERLNINQFGEYPWNLHSVWDRGLIWHKSGSDWVSLAFAIRAKIKQKDLMKWSVAKDPLVWANESYGITRKAYRDLPPDRKVGEAYYEEFIGTVETRLATGGVRLAAMLNEIFSEERNFGSKPHS